MRSGTRAATATSCPCTASGLRRGPISGAERWRLVPIRANGQLAFGHYIWDAERDAFVAHGIDVLTLRDDRIDEINAFLDPNLFGSFGLPDELPE